MEEEASEGVARTFGGCPSEAAEAGQAQVCQGCPGQALCRSGGQRPDSPDRGQLQVRMNAIRRKVLVLSGKGGVGKSTVAAQLATALARRGKKVGLLDVDVCGPSIPLLMGVTAGQVVSTSYGWTPVKDANGVAVMSVGFLLNHPDNPVIYAGPRKTTMIKRFLKDVLWGRLDALIIDTPPGTSDEHLSVLAALQDARPDGAVVVTTPQEVSLLTIRKELNFCKKMALPVLGIVENMSGFVCPCCNEVTEIFKAGGGEALAQEYEVPFLGRVPIDPRVGQCGEAGRTIIDFTEAPAAPAFSQLASNLFH